MEISYDGILLRPWKLDDAARLTVIADNKGISDNLRDGFPHPYSIKDAREWLSTALSFDGPTRFFAITVEKELVGSIGIVTKSDIYRMNCEIGYFLGVKFWGKGIATRAIKAATSYAFKTFDIVRVFAEPFADNQGSRRALEKAGFIMEARLRRNVIKNGIVKDSCIYGVLREEFQGIDPICNIAPSSYNG